MQPRRPLHLRRGALAASAVREQGYDPRVLPAGFRDGERDLPEPRSPSLCKMAIGTVDLEHHRTQYPRYLCDRLSAISYW